MRVVLLSTYDLGRQPFGLASPTAWLRERGYDVACVDLAITALTEPTLREADCIAFSLPMHTATRLAATLIPRVRTLNPTAPLAAFGLYAPLNEPYLRSLGVEAILGGEVEAALCRWVEGNDPGPAVSLDRLAFRVPDRSTLPVLSQYPALRTGTTRRVVGATEATRGCKHLCRHCPVVPVYRGTFRVVPVEVVLADIRQQVAAGAEHITFGDPDFFNGPTHALRVIRALHAEFPHVTYDVTIKVEHLLRHRLHLDVLHKTGCLFVTSAVESADDAVLAKLEKGHTRRDFLEAVRLCREAGLALSLTFIPFTPWTTRAGYAGLLTLIAEHDLVESVAPVQLALRLLIPSHSRLLELEDVQAVLQGYDEAALLHRWRHTDPSVDELAAAALRLVSRQQRQQAPRRETFALLWELVHGRPWAEPVRQSRTTVPFLEEPWYC